MTYRSSFVPETVQQAIDDLQRIISGTRTQGTVEANSAAFFAIADRISSCLGVLGPAAVTGAHTQVAFFTRGASGNETIKRSREQTWAQIDREARRLRADQPTWSKSEVATHICRTLKPTYSTGKPYTVKHITTRIRKLWP